MADSQPRHPSSQRTRVKGWQQYAGLVGAPLAWMTLVIFDFSLADFGCRVTRAINAWMITAGCLCLAACIAGFWIAYGVWRATRDEARGEKGEAIDKGEGRSRFFAITGMLAGGIFIIATLATLLSTAMVGAPC